MRNVSGVQPETDRVDASEGKRGSFLYSWVVYPLETRRVIQKTASSSKSEIMNRVERILAAMSRRLMQGCN